MPAAASLEALPSWARDLLEAGRVGHLGLLDDAGRPRVLPVTFAVLAGRVWSAVDDKPKRTRELRRLRNVRENPHASLLVDVWDEDWTRLAWVSVEGRAAVLGAVPGIALAYLRRPDDALDVVQETFVKAYVHAARWDGAAEVAPWLTRIAVNQAIDVYRRGRRRLAAEEPFDEVAPRVGIVTETNVPHRDNVSYFGDGRDEAQMVYQFPLAPLVLDAFARGDATRLIPALAGQPPGYLAQQMLLFKADTRDPGDPLLAAKKALMRTVPDGQFPDLAAYYSSLR